MRRALFVAWLPLLVACHGYEEARLQPGDDRMMFIASPERALLVSVAQFPSEDRTTTRRMFLVRADSLDAATGEVFEELPLIEGVDLVFLQDVNTETEEPAVVARIGRCTPATPCTELRECGCGPAKVCLPPGVRCGLPAEADWRRVTREGLTPSAPPATPIGWLERDR